MTEYLWTDLLIVGGALIFGLLLMLFLDWVDPYDDG